MFHYLQYLGGLFLGWSLGANHSANVFGTAVSSRMVSYKSAILLTAVFVIIGSLAQGEAGIRTLSEDLRRKNTLTVPELSNQKNVQQYENMAVKIAIIVSCAAACTVTIMTILKMPISTTQAVVGAIIGVGFMQNNINFVGLGKVLACWLGTPVGGALFTVIFYRLFRIILNRWRPSVFVYDPVMSVLLIICGCYGAYALGANNVANVSAIFVGENMLTIRQAALFGGISMAIGCVTYGKPVMMTIGKGIVKLDAFTAFVCVLSHAVTVHMYAIIGVPVSSAQAIVGALLGIGIIKGGQTVNFKTLRQVTTGWMASPFIAAILAGVFFFAANLHYIPSE